MMDSSDESDEEILFRPVRPNTGGAAGGGVGSGDSGGGAGHGQVAVDQCAAMDFLVRFSAQKPAAEKAANANPAETARKLQGKEAENGHGGRSGGAGAGAGEAAPKNGEIAGIGFDAEGKDKAADDSGDGDAGDGAVGKEIKDSKEYSPDDDHPVAKRLREQKLTPAEALRQVGVDPDVVFEKLCQEGILAGFREITPVKANVTRDNVTAAIAHVALSSSSDPEDLRMQSSLGHALFRLQLMTEASLHLERAITLFEKKYGSRLEYQRQRRGLQLQRRQRVKAGGDPRPNEAERSMYDDGKSCAAAHVHLGLVLHNSGGEEGMNDEAAGEHFQAAVELDRHEPAAHTHWAQLLEKKGDFIAALHHFEAALKLDPKDVIALTRCGSIYDQLKDYDKAIDYLERAIAVNDNFESAHFTLAVCLSRGARHREAIPHLRKTVELSSDNGRAWMCLGMALEAAREFDEALFCMEKAMELGPRSKFGEHTYKKALKSKHIREQAQRQLAHRQRARIQQQQTRENLGNVRKARKDVQAKHICAVCDKEGTNCCARCKRAYYCSVDHQRQHWKAVHRTECVPKQS